MSYQIEYTTDSVIFKADTYLDGEKIDCPAIIVQNDNKEEPLETCAEIFEDLKAE